MRFITEALIFFIFSYKTKSKFYIFINIFIYFLKRDLKNLLKKIQ